MWTFVKFHLCRLDAIPRLWIVVRKGRVGGWRTWCWRTWCWRTWCYKSLATFRLSPNFTISGLPQVIIVRFFGRSNIGESGVRLESWVWVESLIAGLLGEVNPNCEKAFLWWMLKAPRQYFWTNLNPILVELIVKHIIRTQNSKAQLFKFRTDIVIIGLRNTFY